MQEQTRMRNNTQISRYLSEAIYWNIEHIKMLKKYVKNIENNIVITRSKIIYYK